MLQVEKEGEATWQEDILSQGLDMEKVLALKIHLRFVMGGSNVNEALTLRILNFSK